MNRLINFLKNEMSMTEVYQPVIVRELLLKKGTSTKEELARKLSEYDLSVVEYYKKIVMRWPKITLTKHEIVTYDRKQELFFLQDYPLEKSLRIKAIQICEHKIKDWLAKRENQTKTSGFTASIRYQILKEAKGKCQLCGIPSSLRPIDIDHIIPRSKADKKGKVLKDGERIDVDSKENLQALCFECNRSKRNSDETDFRRRKKLVRDRIPEIIAKAGRKPIIKRLTGRPLMNALHEKLIEEHEEFIDAENRSAKVAELADIVEVAFAIAVNYGFSKDELIQVVDEKRQKNGGFEQGIRYDGDA